MSPYMQEEKREPFNVLSLCPGASLPRRLFLEASAGTGKTFTIEHYILRSILESSFDLVPIAPRETLVVTFTRAASLEMKERIHTTLREAALYLEEVHRFFEKRNDENFPKPRKKEIGYVLEYVRGEWGAPERILERIWKIRYAVSRYISDIDQSMITTIHGFFDRIVTEYEESLGEGGADMALWLSHEAIGNWVRECLTWSLPEHFFSPQEWISLLASFSKNGDKLIDTIARVLANEALKPALCTSSIFDGNAEKKAQWNTLAKAVSRELSWKKAEEAVILDGLLSWASGKKGATNRQGIISDEVAYSLRRCVRALLSPQYDEPSYDALVSAYPVIQSLIVAEDKKRKSPRSDIALGQHSIEIFSQRIWPLVNEMVSPDALFRRLCSYISHLFRRYVDRGVVKTPQSVIERVASLSSGHERNSFIQYASNRFKIAIIDEFQDTDAWQWHSFQKIFVDNADWRGRILFVGDPKQAIYAFRKADVYSYLEAKRQFLKEEQKTLGTNFRASPPLVEAINCFFGKSGVNKWLFFLPRQQEALEVDPVQAESKEVAFQRHLPDVSVQFHLSSGILGRKKTWPTADIEEQELFPWVAAESLLLIEREKIMWKEIAVLVKDRYQAGRLLSYLKRYSIPSVMVRVDTITESPLFELFLALLDAADMPHDATKIATFLLMTKTETAIEDARRAVQDPLCLADSVRAFSLFRDCFEENGLGGMMHALRKEPIIRGLTLYEWLYECSRGERQLEIDLNHLFEIASSLMTMGYITLSALKEAFSHLNTLFSDDLEQITRRVDVSSDAIQIMTMHRSKGLEFPVVFALGASSRTPRPEKEDSASVFEIDAEKIRQLYVACTRAKRRLYIPVALESSGKDVPRGTKSPIELFFSAHCRAEMMNPDRREDHCSRMILREEWQESMYTPCTLDDIQRVISSFQKSVSSPISCVFPSDEYAKILEERKKLPIEGSGDIQKERGSEDGFQKAESRSPHAYQYREYLSFSSLKRRLEAVKKEDPIEKLVMREVDTQVQEQLLLQEKRKRRGISSSLFGVRFHTAIAAALTGRNSPRIGGKSKEEALKTVSDWMLSLFPSWKNSSVEELSSMVYHGLTVPLPLGEESIPLWRIPQEKIVVEQQFLDRITSRKKRGSRERKESLLYGAIDAILFHQGAFYLIDWKTNCVPSDMSVEEYVAENGYLLQAEAYMSSLDRYIEYIHQLQYAVSGRKSPLVRGGFLFIFMDRLLSSEKKDGSDAIVVFKDSGSIGI